MASEASEPAEHPEAHLIRGQVHKPRYFTLVVLGPLTTVGRILLFR